MYLFKTSGKTFDSVIGNQKHAFVNQPRDWHPGEVVLVSKNRMDCKESEKQIQYVMVLDAIRKVQPGEIESFWPGNEGRWEYLVFCKKTRKLAKPFNLDEILGADAQNYRSVVTFAKFRPEHEKIIQKYLERNM